jgi:hypothetical protein
MPRLDPKDFPLLFAPFEQIPVWHQRVEKAIETYAEGLEAGKIRKVHYDQARSHLGRALEKAWSCHFSERFTHGGKILDLPDEVRDLYYSINLGGLHSVPATAKKLVKSDLDHPAVQAMREVIEQVMPLAKVNADLKPLVIKGRVPAKPKPVNPDQERGTCSCCQRDIALKGQGMAHHGYQRPGDGYQTSSCEGVNFPNLEKSLDGLHFMITVVDGRLARAQDRLEKVGEVTKLMDPTHRPRPNEAPRIVKKGEEGFPYLLSRYKSSIEGEIKVCKAHQEHLAETLEAWVDYHEKKATPDYDI